MTVDCELWGSCHVRSIRDDSLLVRLLATAYYKCMRYSLLYARAYLAVVPDERSPCQGV